MKTKKIDLSPERKIITNMIVSTQFCKEIIPILKPENLKVSYCREVVNWIIEYYQKYQEAPGKTIQDIYRSKRKAIEDEEDTDSIAEFLSALSKDYEQKVNVDYTIEQAVKYLKIRSLEILKELLDYSIINGDPVKGENFISQFKRVEKGLGEGVSILRDTGEVIDAFFEEEESLFQFPGALGKVAGKMGRGDFLAFLAPMKRGKTWYLWYSAETAMAYGNRVLFFSLEMTKKQIIRRGWMGLSGSPRHEEEVKIPYFEKEEDQFEIKHRTEKRKGIDISKVGDFQKRLRRRYRKGDVKIIALPSKSVTVEDLRSYIENLDYYENYIPDVIIIDYADLLKSGDNSIKGDYRHVLDNIWSNLRRMAQERNALVITASQAGKITFKNDVKEGDWAEDIRKMGHITCGLALNQTKKEAEEGIMRVSQIAIREGKQEFDQAVVLQCLSIGKPYLDSKLKKDVFFEENLKKYSRKG